MEVKEIPIQDLLPRADARVVDETKVKQLAGSIKENGLLNPVTVRRRDFYWEVVAGLHRVNACRSLGLETVTCHIVDSNDLQAEIIKIDENLVRNPLSPAEMSVELARRKQLYEQLHPHSKAGARRARAANKQMGRGQDVGDTLAPTFAQDVAKKLGKSERSVQRMVNRGEQLSPAVLEFIKGTPLDTGKVLDAISGMPPEMQMEFVKNYQTKSKARQPHQNTIWQVYQNATKLEQREFIRLLQELG